MLSYNNNTANLMSRQAPLLMQSRSPPIIGIPDTRYLQTAPLSNTLPPQVIHKPSNQEVTYKQNVFIRWLQPPTPPPLPPIIIREIQCPPEVPPPIIYRQISQCPPTPPPIIVREQPPPCPPSGNPVILERRLPRTCLPPQVFIEQCPPPAPKPQTIIYEKYLPQPDQQRQVIVQRETCQPTVCCAPQQQVPCRRVVREIVRQVPQQCTPAQPALICTKQQPQQLQRIQEQSQVVQQLVPVFATRRKIVQPKVIRVIRQVIGPAPSSTMEQACAQQQFSQIPYTGGQQFSQIPYTGGQQFSQIPYTGEQQFSQIPYTGEQQFIHASPTGFIQ